MEKKSVWLPKILQSAETKSNLALEVRMDTLEAQFRILRNEWLDSSDKLAHMADRLRKRIPTLAPEKQSEKSILDMNEVELELLARQKGLMS